MSDSKIVSGIADSEECRTTVDSVRMRYLRAGSGPPLILLHGLLGYSFSWRFNISALAQNSTVYAVDMPGVGFSERSSDLDYSFRGSAKRLLKFAEKVGLTSFDLLGTSHGGAVAMMAAAIGNRNEGQRVRRLILVAPVNPWSPHGRHLAPFLSDRLVSGALAWTMPHMRFSYGAVLRRLYGDPRRIAPGTLEGYTKPYTDASSFEYGFRVLSTWNEDLANLEDAIPEIAELPVLLIWGSLDRAVLPESAAILGRHFRNADLVMLEGVGHLPYEEMPEAFNAAVIKFLSEGSRR